MSNSQNTPVAADEEPEVSPGWLRFPIARERDKTFDLVLIGRGNVTPLGNAQRLRALALLKARGMLRLKDFIAGSIGPETLGRLVREEAVIRPARGLYRLSDMEVEVTHALAEATLLVPKGVICLISALQYHELTLQMPSTVWMAIDRAAWRPQIDYPRIRFVRFTGWALTEGVEHHPIENVDVSITDPARTIVDCFRYRAKIGLDVAMEGLREGLRQRRCDADLGLVDRMRSTNDATQRCSEA